MAKLSDALRNDILQYGFKNALQGGCIKIYSGSAPTYANMAVSGTLLITITASSGAFTGETRATGSIQLTGGASGSVNTVTVNGVNLIPNGAVNFNTSLAQTAIDLARAINEGQSSPDYEATVSGTTVTLIARRGTGATPNGFTVSGTLTTITAAYVDMAGGVAAVNGLSFNAAAGGVIQKLSSQIWSGAAAATGACGYFRWVSGADAGADDSAAVFPRLQGTVGTSGAELIVPALTLYSGATYYIDSFSLNVGNGS